MLKTTSCCACGAIFHTPCRTRALLAAGSWHTASEPAPTAQRPWFTPAAATGGEKEAFSGAGAVQAYGVRGMVGDGYDLASRVPEVSTDHRYSAEVTGGAVQFSHCAVCGAAAAQQQLWRVEKIS